MQAEKDNDMDLPPEPPERTSPSNTLILGLLTFGTIKMMIKLYCFEQLSLWWKASFLLITESNFSKQEEPWSESLTAPQFCLYEKWSHTVARQPAQPQKE